MAVSDLPYFLEDTTGLVSGPTDFLDKYDRPPFLRVESATTPGQPIRLHLAIFELGAHTLAESHQRHATQPSAVISFHGMDMRGSIRFQTGIVVQLERWLKKSTTFGSALTRQFKATDGVYYKWSFRSIREHEWACVQLDTDRLIAHYDLKPVGEQAHRTSGNVLTVYENWIHLAVDLLASLALMRHIHANISQD